MLLEKTNISARVEITLKKIVEDSSFTHKDAYELGAKLIAMGNAEDTLALINTNPEFERIIKQTEYRLIEARKQRLERELKDL
jgi:anti-anti-sigma regulatory factor